MSRALLRQHPGCAVGRARASVDVCKLDGVPRFLNEGVIRSLTLVSSRMAANEDVSMTRFTEEANLAMALRIEVLEQLMVG